jgi:hypothetical protein
MWFLLSISAQAMYQRRADILSPLMHELGRNAFSDLLRAISFEVTTGKARHCHSCEFTPARVDWQVGEIYMELTELKQGRMAGKRADDPK